MSERDKLQQRAQELAASRHAERRESERRLAEYQRRRVEAISSLRAKLEALKSEYAGTVALSLSGSPTSVHVSISKKSTALQKPFASLSIRPDGDGFYVTDEIKKQERYDILFKLRRSEDQIVELVKDISAEFLIKAPNTPYEFPEWYTVLITIVAALGCFAGWVAIALAAGFWGAAIGAFAMVGLFKILTHVGPWIVLLAAGVAVFLAVGELLASR